MKISDMPGEYGFRAAYKQHGTWQVTESIFFTLEEAQKYFNDLVFNDFKWPVEVQEGGIIYVPSQDEI